MGRAIKYLLWILGSIFLLILILLLLTQTAFFREKVKEELISQSSKFLNISLEIEKLNGNFFSWIELENILLNDKDKEVFQLESLKVNYNLRALLKKEIRIDSVLIVAPEIKIWQRKDSSWSFESYLLKQQKKEEKQPSKFGFNVSMPLIYLQHGAVEMETLSHLIPKKVDDLDLQAGFSYSNRGLAVDLREFNFNAYDPSIILKELTGRFSMNKNEMRLENLVLRTSGTMLDANANYRALPNFQTDIDAMRIDSSELALFIPDIRLKCSPSVVAKLNAVDDVFTAQLELSHNTEKVEAEIRLDPLSALTEKSKEVPFTSKLLFNNFNIENWIDINDIHAQLEGSVLLEGNDLLHPDRNTKVQANLTRSTYNGVYFKTFNLNGSWAQNTAQADLNLSSDFGNITVKGLVQNLNSTQDYEIDMKANQLNLEAFVPQMENTILNANVRAQGAGFDAKKLKSHADIELNNSLIYNFQVDTLSGIADLKGNEINIDTLFVQAPGVEARGQGTVRIDSLTMNANLTIKADSLSVIDSLVKLPVTFDSLLAQISLYGPFSRLQINGEAEVNKALAYDVKLEQTKAQFRVDLNTDSLTINASADASDISYQEIHGDSLNIDLIYLPGKVWLKTGLVLPDTLDLQLEASIDLGDTLTIDVPFLELRTFLSDYYFDDTLHVTIEGNDKFKIKNLHLLDHSNPDFLLLTNGVVAMNDTNSLQLSIHELDLGQINRFFMAGDSIGGILNSEVSLTGLPRYPELSGTMELKNPSYGIYQISALNGSFHYQEGQARAEIVNPDLGDDFKASISVPMDAYLDSMNFVFSKPDSFETAVVFRNIDLHQYAKPFVPQDSISGILNIDLTGKGSLQNPEFFGGIKLDRASYENKQHGINYSDIKASVIFEGNKVNVDTVLIRQKKGFLTMSGELAFDSSMIYGNLVASSLKADASNFFLTQNRNYEILIDANTFIRTGDGTPEYGGKVKVLRSDVFLPAIIKESGPTTAEDVPMLVEALKGGIDTLQVLDTVVINTNKSKEVESIFLDRLRGKLRVEIPRNTWIRSDDMRLELSGDVDVVKTGSNFELFGNVKILRGYYLFYGKKLNVDESEVIFEGGEEFDPTLNFKAEYIFRGSDRQKRYLDLILTGKLSDPTISFTLDGTQITENDGVSVLLFGTTSDQIGYSEQQGMIGAMSSQALASMITSQLSKTLGTQLNLDMIEITATDNWQSAAFVVGKYITNDIFVIYERGFGEVDGDEITPETVTIEYELNDKLFLRLQSGSSITSGFDVILKFEEEKNKRKSRDTKSGNQSNE